MSNDITKTKQQLVAELLALGVHRAVIEYSGSGDSGAIDEVAAYMDVGKNRADIRDVDELNAAAPLSNAAAIFQVTNRLMGNKDNALSKRLEQFGYDVLEHLNVSDWVNNDGGGGKLTIYAVDAEHDGEEVAAGTVKVNHYYNEITSHDEAYEL